MALEISRPAAPAHALCSLHQSEVSPGRFSESLIKGSLMQRKQYSKAQLPILDPGVPSGLLCVPLSSCNHSNIAPHTMLLSPSCLLVFMLLNTVPSENADTLRKIFTLFSGKMQNVVFLTLIKKHITAPSSNLSRRFT